MGGRHRLIEWPPSPVPRDVAPADCENCGHPRSVHGPTDGCGHLLKSYLTDWGPECACPFTTWVIIEREKESP